MGCISDCLSYNKNIDNENNEENTNSKTPKLNISKKSNILNEQNQTNTDEIISNQTQPKTEETKKELNDNDNSQIIQLRTNDNKLFKVPKDILLKANLISELIEDAEKDNEAILLKEVDSKNLELIIEYLQHYKNMEPKEIPKPFPEKTDDEFLRSILNDEWTFNFIQKINIEETVSLINCVEFLQIDGLSNILAAKIAHEMSNCEVEEARKKFGIECDMTEEEIAEYDNYPLD